MFRTPSTQQRTQAKYSAGVRECESPFVGPLLSIQMQWIRARMSRHACVSNRALQPRRVEQTVELALQVAERAREFAIAACRCRRAAAAIRARGSARRAPRRGRARPCGCCRGSRASCASSSFAAAIRLSRSSGSQPTVYSRSRMRTLTGSLVAAHASRVLLQRLQARDHRFHPRARLFVLRQQLRAFARQLFLLLAQAAVFVGQPLRERGELVDARGQGLQLGERCRPDPWAAR